MLKDINKMTQYALQTGPLKLVNGVPFDVWAAHQLSLHTILPSSSSHLASKEPQAGHVHSMLKSSSPNNGPSLQREPTQAIQIGQAPLNRLPSTPLLTFMLSGKQTEDLEDPFSERVWRRPKSHPHESREMYEWKLSLPEAVYSRLYMRGVKNAPIRRRARDVPRPQQPSSAQSKASTAPRRSSRAPAGVASAGTDTRSDATNTQHPRSLQQHYATVKLPGPASPGLTHSTSAEEEDWISYLNLSADHSPSSSAVSHVAKPARPASPAGSVPSGSVSSPNSSAAASVHPPTKKQKLGESPEWLQRFSSIFE